MITQQIIPPVFSPLVILLCVQAGKRAAIKYGYAASVPPKLAPQLKLAWCAGFTNEYLQSTSKAFR